MTAVIGVPWAELLDHALEMADRDGAHLQDEAVGAVTDAPPALDEPGREGLEAREILLGLLTRMIALTAKPSFSGSSSAR